MVELKAGSRSRSTGVVCGARFVVTGGIRGFGYVAPVSRAVGPLRRRYAPGLRWGVMLASRCPRQAGYTKHEVFSSVHHSCNVRACRRAAPHAHLREGVTLRVGLPQGCGPPADGSAVDLRVGLPGGKMTIFVVRGVCGLWVVVVTLSSGSNCGAGSPFFSVVRSGSVPRLCFGPERQGGWLGAGLGCSGLGWAITRCGGSARVCCQCAMTSAEGGIGSPGGSGS